MLIQDGDIEGAVVAAVIYADALEARDSNAHYSHWQTLLLEYVTRNRLLLLLLAVLLWNIENDGEDERDCQAVTKLRQTTVQWYSWYMDEWLEL